MSLLISSIKLIFHLLSIVGIAAVILAFLLLDFLSRTNTPDFDRDLPRTAIVFTGDFDRIHLGLSLLDSGQVDWLFITGMNGDAGLDIEEFPTQFELTAEQINWIENGQISFAPDAHTTLENALEAACWLEQQPANDTVTLITSRAHMARASVALQHGIGPTKVVRVISDSSKGYDRFKLDLVEFGKFTATWIVTLLPNSLWPANRPKICQDG